MTCRRFWFLSRPFFQGDDATRRPHIASLYFNRIDTMHLLDEREQEVLTALAEADDVYFYYGSGRR